MEQWNAYGALWIQQEQEKSATQPNIEGATPVVDSGYTPSTGPVPTSGPPIQSPTPTTGPPIASPTPTTGPPIAGPVPTTSPPMSRPTFVSPGPAPITPVLNSNWNPSHQEMKRGKKGLIVGGSTIAILLVTILILAVLPPGSLSLMDENRDRDSDGLTDAEELILGTDGVGIQDNEEDCPNGDSDWTASAATDYDSDGCRDNGEDSDDDNDGVLDGDDDCRKGSRFTSGSATDRDGDGCRDSDEDDDDDNDGWSDQDELDCGSNPNSAATTPNDLDGDMICDLIDPDDDGDGVNDDMDAFPRDWSEWSDFDGDGTGDNADTDDDNDGVLDVYDVNDYADTALKLTFDYFTVLTDMDYWDTQSETYICLYLEGENVGCKPYDEGYIWPMSTNTLYSLDSVYYLDLPEDVSSHHIQICAWDEDAFDDDRIDINPVSANNCYNEYVDSSPPIGYSVTQTASGAGDGTGWDGELEFSYELVDFRNQLFTSFDWEYGSGSYSLEWSLDYDIYSYYKNLDHTVSGWEDYQYFSTPDAQYVIDLANELESMAWNNGYTSDLEEAEFILAFVRGIPYQFDIDGMGVSEYPKYPIEMLWEGAGDCEDAAALYISLMEALDFDAVLILLEVKQDADDDTWGGHAMPAIHIPNHSGAGFYGSGAKSGTPFYFAEATGGDDSIGVDSWYDRQNEEIYDIE